MKGLLSVIKKIRKSDLCIIGYDFFASYGSWKPIYNYYLYNKNTILINKSNNNSTILTILAFLFGKQVLINGLWSLEHYEMLLFLILRKKTIIYLHETQYAFNDFKNVNKIQYLITKLILKRSTIACVSKMQQSYLQTVFKAKYTYIISNNIILPNKSKVYNDKEDGLMLKKDNELNIIMIGSIQERKGTTLFSEVADLAKSKGEKWNFYWIGKKEGFTPYYCSKNVKWLGKKKNVYPYLNKSDIFFLSSIDDPFPLVCLEALSCKVKCIVYKNVGTAEIINEVKGCKVFNLYEPNEAYKCIKEVAKEILDESKVNNIISEYCDIRRFSFKLNDLLSKNVGNRNLLLKN